jgi:hypothetical protein
LDVVSVVFESMRKQTRSALFTARHCGEQHSVSPKRNKASPILQTPGSAGKWSVCGKMCIVFGVPSFP